MKLKNLIFCLLIFCGVLCSYALSKKTYIKSLKNERVEIIGRNSTFKHTTGVKGGGRGSFILLSQHDIDCRKEKGILNGFHLYGVSGWVSNDNAYEYNCDTIEDFEKAQKNVFHQTKVKFNKDSAAVLANLPRVECKNGFISQFQLEIKDSQSGFNYACVRLTQKNCRDINSDEKNPAWLGVLSSTASNLDEFYIQAPPKWGLVAFQVKYTADKKRVYYSYRICEYEAKSNPTNPIIDGNTKKPEKTEKSDNDEKADNSHIKPISGETKFNSDNPTLKIDKKK